MEGEYGKVKDWRKIASGLIAGSPIQCGRTVGVEPEVPQVDGDRCQVPRGTRSSAVAVCGSAGSVGASIWSSMQRHHHCLLTGRAGSSPCSVRRINTGSRNGKKTSPRLRIRPSPLCQKSLAISNTRSPKNPRAGPERADCCGPSCRFLVHVTERGIRAESQQPEGFSKLGRATRTDSQ